MGKVLTKDGKLLTIDGKVITAKSSKSSGGVVGGIIPTGTKTITKNGKYDVYEYAEVDVNVSSSGSGSVPLFTPNVSANDVSITITDNLNGAFIEKYVTTMNDVVIKESKEKNFSLTDYFVGSDSFRTRTYAKGILPDSDYSKDIYHYKVNFYNDTTLLDTQILLQGNKATLPTPYPTKEGATFIGYGEDPSSEVKSDLVATKPLNLYALFSTAVKDVLSPLNFKLEGYGGGAVCCEYNNEIYIFNATSYTINSETVDLEDTERTYQRTCLKFNPKTETITKLVFDNAFFWVVSAIYFNGFIYVLTKSATITFTGNYIYKLDLSTLTTTKIFVGEDKSSQDELLYRMFVYKNEVYLANNNIAKLDYLYKFDFTEQKIIVCDNKKKYVAPILAYGDYIYSFSSDYKFITVNENYEEVYSTNELNSKAMDIAILDNFLYMFFLKQIRIINLDMPNIVIDMNCIPPERANLYSLRCVTCDGWIYLFNTVDGTVYKYK